MLNNEYPPLGGGQGSENYFFCKELKNHKDIEVNLITASQNKKKFEKSGNLKVYYLDIGKNGKNLHFQSAKELLNYSLKALKLSLSLNKKRKYDLVVAWSGLPSGFLAYLIKKKQKTPYIVLLRGADVPFWEDRWKHLDRFVFSWLSPLIWKHSCITYANSEGLKIQAERFSKNKEIKVIPGGVDTSFFKPSKNKSKNKEVVILGVGRLIKRKGFNYLIEALSNIKEERFQLWLAGDGPEKTSLISLAEKKGILSKVKFLGIKDKNEMLKIYQKADIFCLPSLNEGMSNAILEAMACSLPIITTNTPGAKELINNNGNGHIAKQRNVKDIADKLKSLIINKELREKMGKKSIKIVEKFSFKTLQRSYLKDWLEIKVR